MASVPETAAVSEPVAPEMVKTEPSLADLLRNISCFSRCSNAELQMLIELGNRQFYGVGEIICSEGDPGDAFYIVLEGSVEVRSEHLNQILATLYEGEFFGEIAVLTGMPRSATVRALEETVLFVVHRSAVQRLLQAQPQLAEDIAHELAARQQVLQELGLVNSQEIKSLPPCSGFVAVCKRSLMSRASSVQLISGAEETAAAIAGDRPIQNRESQIPAPPYTPQD